MTNPNPYLKKLGFSATDRLVILHADDLGMCQAGLSAYEELLQFGLLSSVATMVPCPWFPATAVANQQWQQQYPHLDVGVHLTLTSEWQGYRWGPLSTTDPTSGLLDDDGYFFRQTAPLQAHGRVEAVATEIETQLKRALAAGIDVTHIDSHMGSIFHPQYLPTYIKLAQTYQIPGLMFRWHADNFLMRGLDPDTAVAYTQWVHELDEANYPLLDSLYVMPLDSHENRLQIAQQWLQNLGPGIHYFIVHPAKETPELKALAPDWRARVADYELFIDEAWRDVVQKSGVHPIGWRPLRDIMRQ